jgi:hypothetical protein
MRWVVGLLAVSIAVTALFVIRFCPCFGRTGRCSASPASGVAELLVRPPGRIALAVLGNSDSHSYHDTVLLRAWDAKPRGGDFHAVTFQWTEVLSRLRAQAIDLGPWGIWGDGVWSRRLKRIVGLNSRGPRKADFRYNFAITGARCDGLTRGPQAQAPALVDAMDESAALWADGIVLVRIGINDLGTHDALEGFSASGLDAAARARVRHCTEAVGETLALVRRRHPTTRFVLVGILDNADWPRFHGDWQDPRELDNISRVLDEYDASLRVMAAADPRSVFFDDRAWFRDLWGGRDAEGRPAYHSVGLGGPHSVSMTEGDTPDHAVVADGHAGTTWNGLWARDVVRVLNGSFGLAIPDIRLEEIGRLADPDSRWGLRPRHGMVQ